MGLAEVDIPEVVVVDIVTEEVVEENREIVGNTIINFEKSRKDDIDENCDFSCR